MTRMLLLAALALACVLSLSPAFAMAYPPEWGSPGAPAARFTIAAVACLAFLAAAALTSLIFTQGRLGRYRATGLMVFAVLLVCLTAPAFAAEATTSASIPWGDWLVATLAPASAILVPLAAAAVSAGVYKVAPWASLFLSRQRIEMMIQGGADYGQNAVAGVVKGKTISVPLGSAVVAEGVQHILDTSPKRAIAKAGGTAGIAGMVFRALPLDENASVQTVLQPALADLAQRGLIK